MHQQDSSEKGNSIWLDPDLPLKTAIIVQKFVLKAARFD